MFMNKEQLLRRLKSQAVITPNEYRALFQMMEERLSELEDRLESLGRPEASGSAEGKDPSPGTAKRGRPRKSDAKGSEESGSA